ELRDIMPTLLDCAGLPIPETLDGRSFLPFARGERPAWRPHLHGEHLMLGQSLQWVTDGHEKYVWRSGDGAEQLFDLDRDPQEREDLARQSAARARVERWRRVLIEELTGREEGFVRGGELIAGRPVRPCLSHVRPSQP
ncbi:MAG TPA: arylsulfatase, partial [Chloroflexota bacterium]|nr:arylsulfatase [Chloroflexota bacterium]